MYIAFCQCSQSPFANIVSHLLPFAKVVSHLSPSTESFKVSTNGIVGVLSIQYVGDRVLHVDMITYAPGKSRDHKTALPWLSSGTFS